MGAEADSNHKTSCPVSGFQDRCIRPLCHPSGRGQRNAVSRDRLDRHHGHSMAVSAGGLPPLAARARAGVAPGLDRAHARRLRGARLRGRRRGRRGDGRRLRAAARIAPRRAASWPFFLGAAAVLAFFWLFARTMWRGARPRYATGLELRVERQELRRGGRGGVGLVLVLVLERGRDRGRAPCTRRPSMSCGASATSRAAA